MIMIPSCWKSVPNAELQAAAREGTPSGTTLLAYDERMTLHREDAAMPHPERPDRIRAVIARLMSSGLAGASQLHPAPQLFQKSAATSYPTV